MPKVHQPCPDCGSRDALALYEDGHTHCFSCGKSTANKNEKELDQLNDELPQLEAAKALKIRPLATEFRALDDRKISQIAAKKYGVEAPIGEGNLVHVYPYFDADGVHVANKRRYLNKGFSIEGELGRVGLFGQHLFPAGGKYVTLVEGELDALSAYEMFGFQWPVVSVLGASSAAKDCTRSFEYLNSFENIVIAFDKDEAKISPTGGVHYPGQEAALAVAGLFPIGKVKILTFQEFKDSNDYLLNGKSREFLKEWWAAPRYTPAGLKLGKDMWGEISAERNYETIPYPWQSLNDKTYGIRLSEFVIVTGETGDGKTSILKEIEHWLLGAESKPSIGILHLEEPNADTCLGLMSITANKPLHLPDVREQITFEMLREFYDKSVNTERVVIWDHFGSNGIHEVLSKIRHMAVMGCKYVVLDHLSIIVSDQSGDERKQLDEISTKIKMLCMELNISVIAVIHQNRRGEIRGTAGVEQLANIVVKITRLKEDLDDWRRNVSKLVVQKNRFCGRTGPGCYLYYEPTTGRLSELSKEEIKRYEDGLGEDKTREQSWGTLA